MRHTMSIRVDPGPERLLAKMEDSLTVEEGVCLSSETQTVVEALRKSISALRERPREAFSAGLSGEDA
jgi:hypothetical protein